MIDANTTGIQNTFETVVGYDFVASPRNGVNRLVVRFVPVYSDGTVIQDTFVEGADGSIQDSLG